MNRLRQRLSRWYESAFQSTWHPVDPWLMLAVVGLIGIGLVMVFNASYIQAQDRYADPYNFVKKQAVAFVLGTGLMVMAWRLRVRWLERHAYLILAVTALIMLGVLVVGTVRGGAQRWLDLGPLHFQPSELAKTAIILYLAHSIARKQGEMSRFFIGIVPHLVVVGVFALLVVLQPNFSTALILLAVLFLMLCGGGASLLHMSLLGAAAIPVVIAGIWAAPYRVQRVLSYMDPCAYAQTIGFQLCQSLIGISSGGLTGVGFGQSNQKLYYLPEIHTDFIFALVAEELGTIGAVVVVGLFGVIGARGFRIAANHPDPFASLLAFGLTCLILVQAAVNIGVVTGLLPTTGLALPFVSYGGSALMMAMFQVGLLASLSRVAR